MTDREQDQAYRVPFESAWNDLPNSVQQHVRMVIAMLSIWMFLAGFFLGVNW